MNQICKILFFMVTLLTIAGVGSHLSLQTAHALSTEETKPIRQQLLFRKGRHEIMPSIGLSIKDPYLSNLLVGFSYNYYFTNWFSAGVNFGYATFFSTDLKNRIEDEKYKAEESFFIEATYLNLLAGISLQVMPIIGKLMIFNRLLLHYDIHLTAGASLAVIEAQGSLESTSGFAPFFGGGLKLFMNKWLSLNIDCQDYIIQRLLVRSENAEKTYGHNFLLIFGVSIFVPLEVEKSL